MQETDFIQQNKDKWKEFEDVLKTSQKDPERLTDLFIETTDDLSFSRTYYPNRSVRVYLNGIAQQVYQTLYKNKAREKNILFRFWKEDLPQAMWYSRKGLLLSFILFATGLLVGCLSSIYYPNFAKIMLGDSYVEMTKANIANGDPMAVYKDSEPISMFLRIAWNNIRIAYGTFILGILFGLGTVYVILYNSVMVGAFIYFFIERGLFKESFLAIMLHGTLELSMIVVAGCAGFTLARGVIFPGTYTRGQAIIQSARSGIKILIGVTVLLAYAAIIESFATRHTEMPDIVRLIIILLSATIVIGYFVWYPWHLHKTGKIPEIPIEEKPLSVRKDFQLNTIKSAGKIFTETFNLFARNIRLIAYLALAVGVVVTLFFGLELSSKYHAIYDEYGYYSSMITGVIYPFSSFNFHLNFERFPVLYPLLALMFSVISLLILPKINRQLNGKKISLNFTQILNSIFLSLIAMLPLLLEHGFTVLTIWFWFPFCLMWLYTSFNENRFFLKTLGLTWRYIKGNFWKMTGCFLSIVAVQWVTYLILSSQVIMFIGEFIQANVPRNAFLAEEIPYIVATFMLFFIPAIMMTLPLFSTALFYYSAKETNEASDLRKSIEKIGFKKRAYGLEKEA